MSAIRPGGALLELPREIRDEIYSHCFNESYLVFWSYCDHDDYNEHILADLAILRISKVISSDAQQFLFSKAASTATTFKYVIELYPYEAFSTPPTKEATDRMTNVEFEVLIYPECRAARAEADGYKDEGLYPAFSVDPICEATIDHFTGTTVIRDSLRIMFEATDFDNSEESFGAFMETRFFQALKELHGFRNLTVVLAWSFFRKGDSDLEAKRGARELQMELEPHLGSSVIKIVTHHISKFIGNDLDLVVELEFQPRKLYVELLRAKAAGLTKEAIRLTEKAAILTKEADRLEG